MKRFTGLFVVLFLMMAASTFAQGVTTSAINGRVLDSSGEGLPGANVVAVHQPSGTQYGAMTDFDGFYRISNMRVGGPYLITISYVGFETFTATNINLQLGDSRTINSTLSEAADALSEVVITAERGGIFDSSKTGAETNVSQRQVNALPSISRNIADFARLTPQAQVSGDDVISIAGQNNRYNALYIDGAVNNDVFGLAASGTNGGQTGVSPISLDAIESFQINVAPFDVRQSGFAGGSINAITKSGTNQFEGSVYGFYRDQSLAGKTPVGVAGADGERERLEDFTAVTTGVRVGGPIIKDKLFFFVNYERQDNETPQPFDISNYRGDATAADMTTLTNFLTNEYGYNPGGYANNTSSLVSDKLIGKIDWNINDKNKLSFKHSYVKAVQLNAPRSNQGAINFFNSAINFESVTNSSALELSSQIGDNMSNNLVVGWTTVNDNRDPQGEWFPAVQIFDAAGSSINFGSEAFSTANLLEQSTLTITDNFNIYSGRHNITIGTNNEFSSSRNVFFRQNFGEYRYSSLNDFLTGERANRYRHGYSLIGGFGDDSQGAAEFDVFQFGLYIQDKINLTDNFKVTVGARIDVPFWDDGLVNDDFNNRTIPMLEAAGKDLRGARVGEGIDANVHFSPRLGFNWDVNGDRSTQVRGGTGVFTSRLPLVWPGGVYNNNGLTAGFIQRTGDGVPAFSPDPRNQLQDPPQGSGQVGGEINLFAKDFKLPQVWKTNIAVDQRLPGDWILSADFIYNDDLNAVAYENINLEGPQFMTTGAGSRPNYGYANIDNTYDAVYMGYNVKEGNSYNVSGTITKNFYSPFIDVTGQVSYSYGDSNVFFDATSSQNSSQWRNLETVMGSNRPMLSRSDFAPGHRIISNSTIEFKWNDNLRTRIGLFYEGAQGQPFSYVYNGSGLLSDTGSFSALAFIPSTQAEANLIDSNSMTASQQWTALNAYIEGDEYLSSRRGQFAERNADRTNWTHILDLKFAQEFRLQIKETNHRFEFTADIFNFTNFLNKEWGQRTFANFGQVQLARFEGFAADGTTPQFTFDPRSLETRNIIDDSGLQSSRWQMQVGLRYSF
ncbi:TonB-dependent receptor [Antarcticibacterium flavum]|uniref:TonB-dependent receptor n=1 Tax=Antarcticibacterium flavum TaxID=2058175 RepID=A0A5B7X1P6_9FLAO|nr:MULTISPECIES: TonB-dependent receptor [Antarcticibacterium]MCM4159080.1 TonB-dependent receptor [Antarcticibacterium sp. W02-3]QCY69484.1 TonB-dependent receptor [Antarcticibacterium flavum]